MSSPTIVLIAPSLPENVGMVARAMRSFGLADLVLVGGVDPRHPLALSAAAGADPVLESATVVRSLEEALEGVDLAIGTSARRYDRPDLQPIGIRQAALLGARSPKVAWVFGTERHGLTREGLHLCQQVARIPCSGPSLNLAQAVAVCLYEATLAYQEAGRETRPTMRYGIGSMDARRIADWLEHSGIATPQNAGSKAHTIMRIASRLDLNPHEAGLLESIVRRLAAKMGTGGRSRPE